MCPLLLPWEAHRETPFPTSHPMHILAAQKITERFFHNPEKPADEDVAERVFLILEECIQLRYHCREDHITVNTCEFLPCTEVDSKGNKIMTPDMCVSFEVGLGAVAGTSGWQCGEQKALGPSVLSQLGMETPASQLGNSSLPLGKIKSSHLRTLLFAASLKIFPLSTKNTPHRPSFPRSWDQHW